MIIINKNRPIRFKIKGLIIIILSEPRNDYNHTSGPRACVQSGISRFGQPFHRHIQHLQPFSQKSLTATVLKVSQIGLCGVVVADLELFCNSWSVGFSGERLYAYREVAQ